MGLFRKTAGILGFRFVVFENGALASGIAIFCVGIGFEAGEDGFFRSQILLLGCCRVIVGLLNLLIECLFGIFHRQLLIDDADAGCADAVARLKAVEERNGEAETDGLAGICLKLVAEREIRIVAVA